MGRRTVYNYITTPETIEKINPDNKRLMADFLDYLISADRNQSTVDGYASDLKIFFCWNLLYNNNKYFVDLKKREIAQFQKFALTEWMWSPNRLARVKSVLSSLSNYIENMMDDELPDYRPIVRKIESPVKQDVRPKTILTEDEVDMVLNKLVEEKKYQQACAFALAAFSGSRKAELLLFKTSYFTDDNIMENAALYKTPEKIRTKGRGKTGKLLTKYTLLDFKRYYDLWMAERERLGLCENNSLFVNPTTGETMKVTTLNSYTHTITNILGRPFYFHSLRHQLCTRLMKAGVPSDMVQQYFGWANISMLSIYNDNDASDSFGEYFTAEGIKGATKKSFNDL